MVVLMCCCGDQIVEDYVSEMTETLRLNKIPDILFYNREGVKKTTHIILLALLMNLIDSDDKLSYDPPGGAIFGRNEKRLWPSGMSGFRIFEVEVRHRR